MTNPLISGPGGYRLDLDRLERDFAAGPKAFLLCNPHNPTGTVFTRDELSAVADLAERHDVQMVVDEILAPLVHSTSRQHIPFPSLDRPAAARAVSLVSASKAWNLAGLKAALAVPGRDAHPMVAAMDGELDEAAGLFGVLASETAFADGEPWLDEVLRALDGNRLLLAAELDRRLPDIGYRPPTRASRPGSTSVRSTCLRTLPNGSCAEPGSASPPDSGSVPTTIQERTVPGEDTSGSTSRRVRTWSSRPCGGWRQRYSRKTSARPPAQRIN
ncbi:aminotransferase class I/II-fold pyridoxal phosphate-dependent enzyme [Kitasatospora acidiphila]|uniref:aminotransferase class I/II-fold pyridoxal phosphate-dependent enzyme n=1 Tax=Kitasatospora acidiphila TaxID=2567942 RepID=UPI0015F074DA|nr:aminotransferase class I/II-fold pyridoxal phosphate-dependent enzyme [Kitasatospora acidiphila]